jgi:hypothetical protein
MIPTLQMMFLHSLGAAPYDVRGDLIPPTDVQFDSRIRSYLVVVECHDALVGHGALESAVSQARPSESPDMGFVDRFVNP